MAMTGDLLTQMYQIGRGRSQRSVIDSIMVYAKNFCLKADGVRSDEDLKQTIMLYAVKSLEQGSQIHQNNAFAVCHSFCEKISGRLKLFNWQSYLAYAMLTCFTIVALSLIYPKQNDFKRDLVNYVSNQTLPSRDISARNPIHSGIGFSSVERHYTEALEYGSMLALSKMHIDRETMVSVINDFVASASETIYKDKAEQFLQLYMGNTKPIRQNQTLSNFYITEIKSADSVFVGYWITILDSAFRNKNMPLLDIMQKNNPYLFESLEGLITRQQIDELYLLSNEQMLAHDDSIKNFNIAFDRLRVWLGLI